jgi:2-oxoglutarate ferredoxin oxidoreductase subunit delta
MAGKIIIDTERCKGCGLCVAVCPNKNISISEKSNKKGYFPAQFNDKDCTGCAMCAIICPEAIIEVLVDNNVAKIKETGKKAKMESLPKEQANKTEPK